MPIRFKVDEDLPHDVAVLLREAGHDAATVTQEGLTGTSDHALWQRTQQENRCLLTADKGFANARSFPPGTHAGIVLCRMPRESRAGYLELIRSLLAGFDMDSVTGAIVVATPEAIRVHRGE